MTVLQVCHDIHMVSRHCDMRSVKQARLSPFERFPLGASLGAMQTLFALVLHQVALSPQNLLAIYSPAFGHYQHHH
ncbi:MULTISPECIES: hypothetical protein [Brasilonema]|nr:hypothetical protein [Brasilonema sennae]